MGVTVLASNSSFVRAGYDLQRSSTTVLQALTYLPARLFPRSSIIRYFGAVLPTAVETSIAMSVESPLTKDRLTLVEASVLSRLIREGIVHEQEPSFRLTPVEIVTVITSLRNEILSNRNGGWFATPEVLPFTYIVGIPSQVLLDVRMNHSYQQINGILLQDEFESAKQFKEDFDRICAAQETIDPNTVLKILDKAELYWNGQGPLDTSLLPKMLTSRRY